MHTGDGLIRPVRSVRVNGRTTSPQSSVVLTGGSEWVTGLGGD